MTSGAGTRRTSPSGSFRSEPPASPTPATGIQRPARSSWKFPIAVASALAIFLGVIFAWLSWPLPSPKVTNTVQLTHDGVPKTNVLTDGSRLYITEYTGSRQYLMQASVAGGDTSRIDTPFNTFFTSDISPDHSRLLVSSVINMESESPLWILPLPSDTPYRLGNIVAHDAAWSSDGRQVAFSKKSDLYLADANGANARKLVTLSGSAYSIRFSPDGTRLRFTLDAPQTNSSSIWEIRADGSDLHPLFSGWHNPPSECCGFGSADASLYFFLDNSAGSSNIWAVRDSTQLFYRRQSVPFQLTTGPMSIRFATPSPDGKRLFADGYVPRGELVSFDTKSHGFVPYLSGMSAGELDFSRDGKWVAYVSFPERNLWRSRADGSERLQLTFPPVSAILPHWSPDDTQIVYTNIQSGQTWTMFAISAQGGTPERILPEKDYQMDAHWSPDGKKIIFGRVPFIPGSSQKVEIEVLDLNSRRVSALPGSENLFSPHISPNGKLVAALSSDSKNLLLFDSERQKWTNWVNDPDVILFPTWSRDGRFLYYAKGGKTPAYNRVQLGQSRPEKAVDLKDLNLFFQWCGLAPDNSALFIREASTDEIYGLDLELP